MTVTAAQMRDVSANIADRLAQHGQDRPPGVVAGMFLAEFDRDVARLAAVNRTSEAAADPNAEREALAAAILASAAAAGQ